jgi:Flp pilus assembly protein TadG
MKKSPLNSIAGAMAGLAGRGQSKGGITKDIVNRVNTMWADRTRDSRTQDTPSFQTGVQGDISENMIQTAPETPLADPFTNPGASVAAENMFGATIPGSFDRSMGTSEEEIF